MLDVDAALGDGWDQLGELFKELGKEDASGARRALAELLVKNDYEGCERWLHISRQRFDKLRKPFVECEEVEL